MAVKGKRINSDGLRDFYYKITPNPFNSDVNIHYHLPDSGKITVKIYDQLGKEIVTLADTIKSKGLYIVPWNGKDRWGRSVSTGSYFCKIEFNGYNLAKKITLLR